MENSVRSRSNHYDTLQVAPSASSDEIVEAFSSQMRSARVRPDISVARLAQLSVAYETLRDPTKRRAYDASLGLTLKPKVVAPVAGTTLLERLNRVAESAPTPRPPSKPNVTFQGPTESRVAAFIAASVREPAKRADVEPAPVASRPPVAARPPEPPAQSLPPSKDEEASQTDPRRLSLGRTGAMVGAGAAGLAVLALALAWPQANPDRLAAPAAQPQTALTVPLPAVGTAEERTLPEAAAAPSTAVQKDRPKAQEKTELPTSSTPGIDQLADAPVVQSAEVAATDTTQAAPDVSETPTENQPAPDTAQASVTSAKLPLPNATIARTIERIGYGCGAVVSASAVEGADGVFKVSCSSGDAYRAAPVGGRYHFRRWGSH